MIKSWRGKGKTLLKKGFSPFPAPLSSFLKLLLFQADLSLFKGTRRNFLHYAAFFVPERRTRYRKAQDLPAASTTVIEVYRRPGGLMSSETPERGKAAFRPAFAARPSVIPPKYPEISSLLTTVRLLSDRSRPPQVGATAHTCTASADRTAPRSLATAAVSPLPRVFGYAPCSRAPAPPNGNTVGGIRGARGGNYFPRRGPGQSPAAPASPPSYPSPMLRSVRLPILPFLRRGVFEFSL